MNADGGVDLDFYGTHSFTHRSVGQPSRVPDKPEPIEEGGEYPSSRLPSVHRQVQATEFKDHKRRPWLAIVAYDALALLLASFVSIFFSAFSRVILKEHTGYDGVGVALASGIGVWLALSVVGHITMEFNSALTMVRWWMPDWRHRFGGMMWGILAAVIFLIAIFLGALLAAVAAWGLQLDNTVSHAGVPMLGSSPGRAFALEALGTFFWAWSFYATSCWSRLTDGSQLRSGPIVQGFVFTGIVYLAQPYSGGSFNPLGWLATAWVGEYFQDDAWWVHFFGPIVGALVASFAWLFLFANFKKAEKKAKEPKAEKV